MISLHDHHILEFSVDVANRRLRFATELRTESGSRRAAGVFDGVEAYVVYGDMLGTIIFGIDEVDPIALYDEHAENMQATHRRSGGHAPWVVGRGDAVRFFASNGVRGFDLSSSIGCTGAIWARSYRAEWTG